MGAKIVSNNGNKTLPGVHVPHHKNTNDSVPQAMPVPAKVYISLHMHMGAPCNPLVKKGDYVKVGQLIGSSDAFMSARTHSSVSGTVEAITTMTTSIGNVDQVVVIATDGKQEVSEEVQPPVVNNYQEFLEALKCSGLVGLGGAGFPAHVKFNLKDLNAVDTLIINAAECEPYITTDLRTILDKSDMLLKGIKAVQKYMEIGKVYIGIEDNKPECIARYRELVKNEQNMEVMPLKAMYPQGGEKVLIYHVTGEKVPEGKLPLDVGAVVLNCTTISSIARYCRTGLPLVKKCVTVDGSAVKNPMNVLVPIGMRMKDVFEATGGFKEEPKMVLYGGPMMGIAVPDLEQPILKNTNAILAFGEAEATPPEPTACIKCGKCIAHCPLSLMPCEMETAYKKGNIERLMHLKVNLCMECGCCSFICPAHRPLVQTNKLAKAQVMAYKNALKAKAEAEKQKEAAK